MLESRFGHGQKPNLVGCLLFVQSKEQEDALVVDDNLGFAKDRTISRLLEMQSREYLIVHAEHHAPELVLALKEANKHSENAPAK